MITHMAQAGSWRALAETRGLNRDDGTSLLELVIGMTIMSIFLAMFTSAVVMMNRAENKAEAVTVTSTQLNQAFILLDKTVRYASAISLPGTGTPTGDWYVELRRTDSGAEVCTQFRVDIEKQELQMRIWKVSDTGSRSAKPVFTQVSSNISNGAAPADGSDQPFALKATSPTVPFQQLTINMVSPSGSGSTVTTSRSSFTFGAMNSVIPSPTSPICQEEGRP